MLTYWRLLAGGCLLEVATVGCHCRLRTVGCVLEVFYWRLLTGGCLLEVAHCRLRTGGFCFLLGFFFTGGCVPESFFLEVAYLKRNWAATA